MTPSEPSGHTGRRRASALFALLWTALILLVSLFPTGSDAPGGILLCVLCGDAGAADVVLNVFLYLPLGFALRLRTGSWVPAIAAGFALSLGVETAQLRHPGRFTTVADVVANTVGAGMGAFLAATPRSWLLPSPSVRRGLSAAALVAAMLALWAPAVLFAPSVPGGVLYGNWTPRITSLAPYEGRIVSASIGDLPLPSQRLEHSEGVRSALAAGIPLTIHVEIGPPPPSRALLFRLLDDRAVEAVSLAVEDADLIVRIRSRADAVGLAGAAFRVEDALGEFAPGHVTPLTLDRSPGAGHRLTIDAAPPVVLGHTVARGWGLFFSTGALSARGVRSLDALWIALLFGALAWWSPGWRWTVGAVAATAAWMALLPLVTTLLDTPFHYYVTGLIGLSAAAATRATAATKWGGAATEPPHGIQPAR